MTENTLDESTLVELLGSRLLLAYRLRSDGHTFKEIGKKLNVGPWRASQIYHKATRRIMAYKNAEDDLEYDLSVRACNCLAKLGYRKATKEQIKAAIEIGELNYGQQSRNFGKKTFFEICEWAGATAPDPGCAGKSPTYLGGA